MRTSASHAAQRRAVEPRIATLFDPIPAIPLEPATHREGPATSAKAAQKALPGARSRAYRLLVVWRDHGPLTADQAAQVGREPFYEARKRASEMLRLGLIEETGLVSDSAFHNEARVLAITSAGLPAIMAAEVSAGRVV